MSSCNSPLILCRLTDRDGKLIDPYEPGAITFTQLCSSKKCPESGTKPASGKKLVSVLVSGYVTVYVEGKDLSPPIPFHVINHFCIFEPTGTFLDFTVIDFTCYGVPVMAGTEIEQIKVSIEIDTVVRSCAYADVLVETAGSSVALGDKVLISVKRVFDCCRFPTTSSAAWVLMLRAWLYQYNASSDGIRMHYTDADELTQYGDRGILSPSAVSYYNLFINGVLQPNVNYSVSAGNLYLLTNNTPPDNQTIILTFVTYGTNHGKTVTVTSDKYIAVSNGTKNIFYNSDELTDYGDKGIPSPDDVSYFNLFINGALQPAVNYSVSEGILELKTTDIPPVGATIILESLTIKDSDGLLLKAEAYAYNARSNGNRIYTDGDEITIYGNGGIIDPLLSSYQNLYSNGVLQPKINYSVQEGLLILNTADAPITGAPVTLQYVRVFLS